MFYVLKLSKKDSKIHNLLNRVFNSYQRKNDNPFILIDNGISINPFIGCFEYIIENPNNNKKIVIGYAGKGDRVVVYEYLQDASRQLIHNYMYFIPVKHLLTSNRLNDSFDKIK